MYLILPHLFQLLYIGFAGCVAGGVAAVFFEAQGHGFEVDGEARPLCPRGASGEAGGEQGLQALAQEVGERVFAEFAVEVGVGGGGFLQVAAEGFFDSGQAAAGAFDLFFEGFFVARQIVFADKGAVADGLGEVVAQGVGVDVFEQHGGLGEALDAFVQVFNLFF